MSDDDGAAAVTRDFSDKNLQTSPHSIFFTFPHRPHLLPPKSQPKTSPPHSRYTLILSHFYQTFHFFRILNFIPRPFQRTSLPIPSSASSPSPAFYRSRRISTCSSAMQRQPRHLTLRIMLFVSRIMHVASFIWICCFSERRPAAARVPHFTRL